MPFHCLSLFLLLWLAHQAGRQLRQVRGEYEEKIYYGKIVIGVAIIGLLSICVGVLTIGRAFYSTLGSVSIGKDIFVEVTRQVFSIGPWASFVAALSDNSALFLASLNTAGIAIAFLAAFTRYDSDKNYQSALDAEGTAEKILARMGRKYDRAVERIAKRYGPKLSNVAAAYSAHTARVITLKRNRGVPLVPDDSYDLATDDVLLTQAREELGRKSKKVRAFAEGAENKEINKTGDETKTVSLVGRDRA